MFEVQPLILVFKAQDLLRQKLKRLENYGHQDECRFNLKPQLIVIVAAVLLLGCGNPDGAKIQAAKDGIIVAAKQAIDDGADVNAETGNLLKTPLDQPGNDETADLLCKHGGKTGEELKAEGKE